MVQFAFATAFALAATVLAAPSPITPDPAGAHNVGNAQGLQFITGGCTSTKDCSQAVVQSCCAFISGGGATGICSGVDVANTNGKTGCGFGDSGSSSAPASSAAAAAAPAASSSTNNAATGQAGSAQCTVDTGLAGSQNAGKGTASQFITGQCLSPADCASGCCVAQASGPALCKAQLVTTQAGGSCDFSCSGGASSASSSSAAAPSVAAAAAAAPSAAASAPAPPAVQAGSAVCKVDSALSGSQNVGKGTASQFITGQCLSAADCASGCCVAQASGPALCKARLVTTQAGLSCDFTCPQ